MKKVVCALLCGSFLLYFAACEGREPQQSPEASFAESSLPATSDSLSFGGSAETDSSTGQSMANTASTGVMRIEQHPSTGGYWRENFVSILEKSGYTWETESNILGSGLFLESGDGQIDLSVFLDVSSGGYDAYKFAGNATTADSAWHSFQLWVSDDGTLGNDLDMLSDTLKTMIIKCLYNLESVCYDNTGVIWLADVPRYDLYMYTIYIDGEAVGV